MTLRAKALLKAAALLLPLALLSNCASGNGGSSRGTVVYYDDYPYYYPYGEWHGGEWGGIHEGRVGHRR